MIHEGTFFGYFFEFLAPTVRLPLFKRSARTHTHTHTHTHKFGLIFIYIEISYFSSVSRHAFGYKKFAFYLVLPLSEKSGP